MRGVRYAAVIAGAYLLLAGAWILLSDRLAAALAVDVESLTHLQVAKGIGFVVVTGGLVFGGSLTALRRLQRQQDEIARSREAVLRADRQATAGLLAASVAHDLGNVMTVVAGGLDELCERDAPGATPEKEELATLQRAVERGLELTRRLSRSGRDLAGGRPVRADAAAVVREAFDLAALHRDARERRLELVSGQTSALLLHPPLVVQTVANLVVNALQATAPGGRVEVRLSAQGDGVRIEVHDDGPGVPEEARERVFEPFYTTRPRGTGLGLLSVRLCAELHGGTAEVSRSELGGACFAVRLRDAQGARPA